VIALWWRRLTTMRTAIILLGLLALAAIPGSLLPQRGADISRVEQYLLQHKTSGPWLDRLSLFDVYAAPWFAAIYLLLTISLVGCLVPRIRLHARSLGARPPAVSPRAAAEHSFHTRASAEQVLAQAARRTRGWRRTTTESSLTADRSLLRESANLAFHVSILVLLLGVAFGSVAGFEGDRVLVEASGLETDSGLLSSSYLTNSAGLYDDVRPGRAYQLSQLHPWTLQLTDFTTTYQDGTTTPRDFDARVRWRTGPGRPWRDSTIRVNSPLDIGGDKVYLLNHGYAPVVRLRTAAGVTVAQEPVVCPLLAPRTGLARCVFKVPDLPDGRQLGFRMTFAPTGVFSPTGGVLSQDPRLRNPDLLVEAFTGNLHTDRAQSVYVMDTTDLRSVKVENLVLADPLRSVMTGLPGGYVLDVTRIQEWASVRVKRDPGKPVVLLGAIVAIGGVLLSLALRRRRVWVRVVPGSAADGGRTLVQVGAIPRTERDREAAQRDAARLHRRLAQDLQPTDRELADLQASR
jgi:cytochrome c biogenesis protein